MHLGQIQRHHNQSTAINLNNPESQSMHLETRLVQLDSAISMELWQVCLTNHESLKLLHQHASRLITIKKKDNVDF